MKLNKLFLMAVMGLGLFACSENELEGNGPEGAQNEGTTYVGFSLKFNDPNTRATTTEDGTAAEQKINTAYVMMADASGKVEKIISTSKKGTGTNNTNTDYYVIQTTPGVHYFYAVVNPDVPPTMEGENATAKTIGDYFNTGVALTVANIASTTGNGNFMMASHEVLPANVEDGVTEDEALKGTKNCFAIQVERATAKVTMTCENTTLTSATNNGSDGTITTPKFTLKGGATKSTRMAQNPFTDITGNAWTYASIETPVYVKQDADADDDNIHRKATPVYCLENINTAYKQSNTTYLNLYTKFVPAKVVDCNSQETVGALKDNPNAANSTAASFYVVKTGKLAGNYILKSELDAFQGDDDTKFPNGVESISAEYEEGICWFGPIWIGQANADDQNGPVVRNTWYNLKITGITLPGEPSEPQIDPEQPLTPPTNVAITLTVMPWNFIDRGIDLQ
jgi:hypothetical protein